MERIVRGVVLVAAMAVAAVACSSAEPDPGAQATTTEATLPATSVVEGDGTTTVVEAPVTFPPDADAEQVVAELGPRLPLSDADRACLVQSIGADPELLGQLAGGVSPDTELFDQVVTVAQRCSVTTTQAPAFAASLNAQAGGTLTPDQLTCLTDGFVALTPEQLDQVIANGLNPSDPANAGGGDAITALIAGCDVEAPA